MVEIVKYNDDDLRDDEIDEVVTRVKAFVINSKNNMLVGFTDEGFQLVEGYVPEGYDVVQGMVSILYNECGIELDAKDSIEPFYEVRYYNRDYKGSGMNRLSDLIYFLIKTDKLPNHKKLHLSEMERAKRLPLELIRRSLFGKELKEYMDTQQDPVKRVRARELLIAFEKYKEIYKV